MIQHKNEEEIINFLSCSCVLEEKVFHLYRDLADKIHHARSILRDLHLTGENTWEKFKGKKSGTLWYYHSLAKIFDDAPYPTLKNELRNLVDEIQTLANLMEKPS